MSVHENVRAALTNEQAGFVNSLFNNNVPAPVIARVLGRMLANPQSVGSIGNDPGLHAHLDVSDLGMPSRMQRVAVDDERHWRRRDNDGYDAA